MTDVNFELVRAERLHRWPPLREREEIERQLREEVFVNHVQGPVAKVTVPLVRFFSPAPNPHTGAIDRRLVRVAIERALAQAPDVLGQRIHRAATYTLWLVPTASYGLAALLCPDHGPTPQG